MFRDLKPRAMAHIQSGALTTSIPEGWTTVRLAQVGTLFKGKGGSREDDSEDGVACIRYGDLYKQNDPRFDRVRTRVTSSRASAYTQIVRGDIVFALSGESIEDIGKSAVCLLDEVTVCGGDSAVFRPDAQVNPEFAAYVLDSPTVGAQKTQAGRGDIIVHISTGALKQLTFDLPPVPEQAAIVKYLRHAHARIDRAVAAKRKLIALLEEQKQAIINQAVTGGPDPSVSMKDSGIPWLGQIPEHWQQSSIGRLQVLVTSGSRGWAEYYSDAGPMFIQSGNLGREMSLDLSRVQRVALPDNVEGLRTAVSRDDVLVCITGALTGNVVHVSDALESTAFINQHVALIRLRPEAVDARYTAFSLRARLGQDQFKASEYGGTKQGLGLADVRGVRIPLPPLEEQRAIVKYLDTRLATGAGAAQRARLEIELLREFRTRLTSDVVTGQLDVREIAARLPEVVEDALTDADSDEDESFVELEGLFEEADA